MGMPVEGVPEDAARTAWLAERRSQDISAWLEKLKEANPDMSPMEERLSAAVGNMAMRIEYLESVIYDQIISNKQR